MATPPPLIETHCAGASRRAADRPQAWPLRCRGPQRADSPAWAGGGGANWWPRPPAKLAASAAGNVVRVAAAAAAAGAAMNEPRLCAAAMGHGPLKVPDHRVEEGFEVVRVYRGRYDEQNSVHDHRPAGRAAERRASCVGPIRFLTWQAANPRIASRGVSRHWPEQHAGEADHPAQLRAASTRARKGHSHVRTALHTHALGRPGGCALRGRGFGKRTAARGRVAAAGIRGPTRHQPRPPPPTTHGAAAPPHGVDAFPDASAHRPPTTGTAMERLPRHRRPAPRTR